MGRVLLPSRARAACVVGALLLTCHSGPAKAELLRIGGTGAAMATMQALGDAFTAFRRGQATAVEVLPTLGSSGAIRAVGDGAIAMAATLRPLRPEETSRGLAAVAYGRTPFIFVTTNRTATGVTRAEILDIYRGIKKTWADGLPLRPILRPRPDSATRPLEAAIPEIGAAFDALHRRGDLPVGTTEQDNLDFAQRVDGSFAIATLAQVISEQAEVRLLTVDGIAPTLINLDEGLYPLHETFFLAFRQGDVAPRQFLDFILSPAGQRILRRHGTLPLRAAP